jgi:hypothetical protein
VHAKKGNKNGACALLYLDLSVAVSKIMTIDNGTTVNLWSNNKKLMTNNEGLVNYGADLLVLSKLSP